MTIGFASRPYAIGAEDDLSVVLDNDISSKRFDAASVPARRMSASVYSSAGVVIKDYDNSSAPFGDAFGPSFSFNDFAFVMHSRVIMNASTAQEILWRWKQLGAPARRRDALQSPPEPQARLPAGRPHRAPLPSSRTCSTSCSPLAPARAPSVNTTTRVGWSQNFSGAPNPDDGNLIPGLERHHHVVGRHAYHHHDRLSGNWLWYHQPWPHRWHADLPIGGPRHPPGLLRRATRRPTPRLSTTSRIAANTGERAAANRRRKHSSRRGSPFLARTGTTSPPMMWSRPSTSNNRRVNRVIRGVPRYVKAAAADLRSIQVYAQTGLANQATILWAPPTNTAYLTAFPVGGTSASIVAALPAAAPGHGTRQPPQAPSRPRLGLPSITSPPTTHSRTASISSRPPHPLPPPVTTRSASKAPCSWLTRLTGTT